MAIKFSEFTIETSPSGVSYLVGYNGALNVQITPEDLLSGVVPYTGATQDVDFGSFNVTSGTFVKAGGTDLQFLMADGTVTTGNGSVYDYEIHVSQVDGNNITGTGTLLNPVATITKALTLATGDRRTIIIHPGTYTENPSITYQYTVLVAAGSSGVIGGNVSILGTVTTNIGCTISGLKMSALTINGVAGTGNINILNCDITGTLTKNGTADYTLIRFCDTGALNILSTAGILTIFGGNPNFITVNSIGASVLVKNAVCVSPVVSVGAATFADCIIIATGTTSNAITTSPGTQIVVANSQILIPSLFNVARVSFSGFYSIINTVYDKINSTLVPLSGTGGSTNSIVYSQFINADKFIKQGGTSLQYLMADGSTSTAFSLNGLTNSTQYLAIGTSGSNFNISSSSITGTHTFNLPDASVSARGLVTTGAQTIGGIKTFDNGLVVPVDMNASFGFSSQIYEDSVDGYFNIVSASSVGISIRTTDSSIEMISFGGLSINVDSQNYALGDITFNVGGSQKAIITNSGKFGINNSATNAEIFQVTGDSRFTGKIGVGTAANGASISLTPSSGTVAPINFSSSAATLKSTATIGDLEVDSNAIPYYSFNNSSRGVIDVEQFVVLSSPYTLSSTTTAQRIFNVGMNGALTVKGSTTYQFECFFSLTNMSISSGSFGFTLGGTFMNSSVSWMSNAVKTSPLTTASNTAVFTTYNTTTSNLTLVTANTTSSGWAKITGTIRVSTGGTLIPQVTLGFASTAIVGVNSYFRIIPIGSSTVISAGNWG